MVVFERELAGCRRRPAHRQHTTKLWHRTGCGICVLSGAGVARHLCAGPCRLAPLSRCLVGRPLGRRAPARSPNDHRRVPAHGQGPCTQRPARGPRARAPAAPAAAALWPRAPRRAPHGDAWRRAGLEAARRAAPRQVPLLPARAARASCCCKLPGGGGVGMLARAPCAGSAAGRGRGGGAPLLGGAACGGLRGLAGCGWPG